MIRDPHGKRALFSDAPARRPDFPVGRRAPRPGRDAFFSAAVRSPGTVVLECSSCHAHSRVSYLEFAKRHLPVWLWTPWRHYSRFMSCPACGHRTWLAAQWLA